MAKWLIVSDVVELLNVPEATIYRWIRQGDIPCVVRRGKYYFNQSTLILWALTKEINNLYKVMEDNSTKNIWGPRHYLDTLTKRVTQLNKNKIKNSLLEIAEIDSSIKGLSSKNPWQAIRDLAISF